MQCGPKGLEEKGEQELTLWHVASGDPCTGQGVPGSSLQNLGEADESSALTAGRRDGVNRKQKFTSFLFCSSLLGNPRRKELILQKQRWP